MKNKPILILSLFFFNTFFLSAQSSSQFQLEVDCDSLLAEKIPFGKFDIEKRQDIFFQILSIIRICELDSIDFQILSDGYVLGIILIELSNNTENNKITYRQILDKFDEFKKTDSYIRTRQIIVLSYRMATIDN